MLPVLDNHAIQEADRRTIEELGVPGLVLMENAATGLVDAVRESFPSLRRTIIVCGPGNNGGDGLAAARHLANGGVEVAVVLLADPAKLSPDAATNLALARSFAVPVTEVDGDELGPLDDLLCCLDRNDSVIIDGLLGTGITRPLGGRFARATDCMAAADVPVVAIDVPTGLNGSSARLPGPVLSADMTVTFAGLKTCHVLPPACEHCGEIAIVDIGIPPNLLEDGANLWWIDDHDVSLLLPHRPTAAHKGTFGHLGIIGGGPGRSGAVAMACRSAVAAGSGLVTAAVPERILPVVDGACLEAMTFGLPCDGNGEASGPGALDVLWSRLTAVALGPGLGTDAGAARLLEQTLTSWAGSLLIDADGLNLLAHREKPIPHRDAPTVLTPHPGELARLLNTATSEVVDNRLEAARECARIHSAVVVAKGFRTVVAEPSGQAWIIPTGDQHLASGGSGDVLTGLVGALLAQGLDGARAAVVGAYLHGRAGELGSESWPAAVPAGELPSLVAEAWADLQRNPGP